MFLQTFWTVNEYLVRDFSHEICQAFQCDAVCFFTILQNEIFALTLSYELGLLM